MKHPRVVRILTVVPWLSCVPSVGLPSESQLSLEEATRVATELVQSVAPEHDCDVFNLALEKVVTADGERVVYIVAYNALGSRCILVEQELSERGKAQGLRFHRRKPATIDKLREQPNFDLIHEVNPPADAGK